MYDIRMLGYHLKVPENTLEAIFHNKKEDIQEVVYQMLTEWKKTQRTPAIAYKALWEALTHSDLNLPSIANDALVNPPYEEDKEPTIHTAVRQLFLHSYIWN